MLEAQGITASEAALAILAAKGLARPQQFRDVAALTLRRLAHTYGPSGVEAVLRELNWVTTPIR